MGGIADAFEQAFREYATDGVPASGPWKPVKADIQAIGPEIETAVAAISSGILRYATVSLMNANTAAPDGTLAYVYKNAGSTSDAANGIYQRNTATSSWVPATWYTAQVAAVVQPLLDATIAAKNAAQAAATSALSKGPLFASKNAALRRGVLDSVSGATSNGNFTWTASTGSNGDFSQTLTPQLIAARDAGTKVTILARIVSGVPTTATVFERNASNSVVATTTMLPLESGNPIARDLVLQATTTNLLVRVASSSGAITLYRPSASIGEPAVSSLESTFRSVSGYRETVLNRVAPLPVTNFAVYSTSGAAATYSNGVFTVPAGAFQTLLFDFSIANGQAGTCRFKIDRSDCALAISGRRTDGDGAVGDFGGTPATVEYVDDSGLIEAHFIQNANTSPVAAMRGLRIDVNNISGANPVTIRDVVVSAGQAVPPMYEVPAVVAAALAAATASIVSNPVRLNTDKLRTFKSKLAAMAGAIPGIAASVSLLGITNSYGAAGYATIPTLRKLMIASYGDGGLGFIPLTSTASAAYAADGSQPAKPANRYGATAWTNGSTIRDMFASPAGRGPDGREITSTAAGDGLTIDLSTATGSGITYAATLTFGLLAKNGGGTVRWRQSNDGGATWGSWSSTVTTDNGAADAIHTSIVVTLPASASGTKVQIETVGEGTNHVTFCGAFHTRTDANGFILHRIGHSSSTSASWAGLAAIWDAWIAFLSPDASLIIESVNDQLGSVPVATEVANYTTIRNRVKAAAAACDNMFVVPIDNPQGRTPTIRQYGDGIRGLAIALNDAFTDCEAAAVSIANYNNGSALGWYLSTDPGYPIHPAITGPKAYQGYNFQSAQLYRSLVL